MTDAIVSRLEAVTARLERLARKQGGGGGDDEEGGVPQYVTDFQALVNDKVNPVIAAADACGAKAIGPIMTQAYDNISLILQATAACKKPSQGDLMGKLAPCVDAINKADKLKLKRSKTDNHHTAFYETLVALSWVTMAPPHGLPASHAAAQGEACDFHLNRILKKTKDKSDAALHKTFVQKIKQLHKAQVEFVKEYFKTGLTWNPKGGEISAYKGGAAPPAPAKAPEEEKQAPAAKPKPKKKAGGIGNVFAELKKKADGGDSAAVGMRKVTKDMKTKNRKKEAGRGKVTMKKKAAAPKKPSKPPVLRNAGGRWMVENYFEGVTELPEAITMKQNAFIVACQNCAFIVKQKIKGITLDSCKKVTIQCTDIVSVIELVNCKSVTLILQGSVPSITVDKCTSPRIVITRAAMNPMPIIVSSNISAGNVEIPGKSEDDDPIEIPMAEQFRNTIDPETATIKCVPVTHG